MPSGNPSRLLSDIYLKAVRNAEKHGVAEHKVKLLYAEIINSTVPASLLNLDKSLTQEQETRFDICLQRLNRHEPIQYVLGKADFYGLTLRVNEYVLIPRPETEGLVEWILQQNVGQQSILDIGTGSGAIALALKHLNSVCQVSATDVSHEAIRLAKVNARQLGLEVTFYQADLFPPKLIQFDVIVSNPPYVSTSEYQTLDYEIRLYEPKLALLAGKDGLSFYRRILTRVNRYLKPGGKLYFEIAETQAEAISEFAYKCGFQTTLLKQDLAGRDRYLCISK
jgi:release factor glutamine methyltransferase